jgi:leader peptidase (prepilin peptidase) / N-methyltransferase
LARQREKKPDGQVILPKCGHKIAWYDNLPVFSFIILRGKCRHCSKKISWQYPAVELAVGILFVMVFYDHLQTGLGTFEQTISLARDWLIITVMTALFVFDLRWYILPDALTLPAALSLFALNILAGFSLWNLLISGIIGSSFFLVQYLISKGKWIGGGDIRMGLLMGIALGWPLTIVAIFLSYILGSLVSIPLLLSGKKKFGSKIPLGVFLAAGTVITVLWGTEIKDFYFNIFL